MWPIIYQLISHEYHYYFLKDRISRLVILWYNAKQDIQSSFGEERFNIGGVRTESLVVDLLQVKLNPVTTSFTWQLYLSAISLDYPDGSDFQAFHLGDLRVIFLLFVLAGSQNECYQSSFINNIVTSWRIGYPGLSSHDTMQDNMYNLHLGRKDLILVELGPKD